MFRIKKENKFCRRFFEDIRGNIFFKRTKSANVLLYLAQYHKKKDLKSFVFVITEESKEVIKPRFSMFAELLEHRKKVSYFYGGFSKRRYKKIADSFYGKGNFLKKFVGFLELRLSSVVYRMNICRTVREATILISKGYILVNKEVKLDTSYVVNLGDIIQVVPNYREEEYFKLMAKSKVKDRCILFDNLYLLTNYELMSCIVYTLPVSQKIYYPFGFSSGKLTSDLLSRC